MGLGVPARKKGNRVNTISARVALANYSDDPYRSYFIILHISLRELLLRGAQQPHETGGGGNEKKKSFSPLGQPNGNFNASKNVVHLSSLMEWHFLLPMVR